MDDQVLKLAKEITALEGDEEALFAFLCVVAEEYIDLLRGRSPEDGGRTEDRNETIEMVVEALEENLH